MHYAQSVHQYLLQMYGHRQLRRTRAVCFSISSPHKVHACFKSFKAVETDKCMVESNVSRVHWSCVLAEASSDAARKHAYPSATNARPRASMKRRIGRTVLRREANTTLGQKHFSRSFPFAQTDYPSFRYLAGVIPTSRLNAL